MIIVDWIKKQITGVAFRYKVFSVKFARFMQPVKFNLAEMPIEKFGNDYSFVFVPKEKLDKKSIVYSIGVGEDIISDIEMVNKIKCGIVLIDPTPKSKKHFDHIFNNIKAGQPAFADNGTSYDITKDNLEKLTLHPYAIYNEDKEVKFFLPKLDESVSYSITNIQNTKKFIKVKARKMKSLMNLLKHDKIDFLKLDIEGAEFEVLEDIIKDKVDIKTIYVEYHYNETLGLSKSIEQIQKSVNLICENGYAIYHCSDDRYIGFTKN